MDTASAATGYLSLKVLSIWPELINPQGERLGPQDGKIDCYSRSKNV